MKFRSILVIAGDVFCHWLRAVYAIFGSRRQPRSISCNLLNVQSEGMRDICGISINHYGCLVISGDVFDISNVLSLRKTMARVCGNCRCCQLWSISRHRLYFTILRNTHNFACLFCRLFCLTPFHILCNINIHHQTGQQWSNRSWHLQP